MEYVGGRTKFFNVHGERSHVPYQYLSMTLPHYTLLCTQTSPVVNKFPELCCSSLSQLCNNPNSASCTQKAKYLIWQFLGKTRMLLIKSVWSMKTFPVHKCLQVPRVFFYTCKVLRASITDLWAVLSFSENQRWLPNGATYTVPDTLVCGGPQNHFTMWVWMCCGQA